jgi:hypothetical protein
MGGRSHLWDGQTVTATQMAVYVQWKGMASVVPRNESGRYRKQETGMGRQRNEA